MFAKKTKELPKVDPVKIKPLFGMKPGLWLTIAYILALLLILFLVDHMSLPGGILSVNDLDHEGSKLTLFILNIANAVSL